MDILDPKLLDHSFNAEIVGDTVQFELDAPDNELEGDDRIEIVYALRVVDFAAFVIVTANGVELLREQLAGTVLDRVQGIWKEAQWHMDNRNRQIQAESERVRERVAAAIKDI